MNCVQGDLAVIVRSVAGNDGVIVRCLRLVSEYMWIAPDGSPASRPTWETDRNITGWNGDTSPFVEDSILRPIRDNDAKDETLSWKCGPAPKEVPTPRVIPAVLDV